MLLRGTVDRKIFKPTYSASVIPPFQTNSFSWFILSFNVGVNYTYLLSNIKIRILAVADHGLIPKFPVTLKKVRQFLRKASI